MADTGRGTGNTRPNPTGPQEGDAGAGRWGESGRRPDSAARPGPAARSRRVKAS